jgi:hypothetical protein
MEGSGVLIDKPRTLAEALRRQRHAWCAKFGRGHAHDLFARVKAELCLKLNIPRTSGSKRRTGPGRSERVVVKVTKNASFPAVPGGPCALR